MTKTGHLRKNSELQSRKIFLLKSLIALMIVEDSLKPISSLFSLEGSGLSILKGHSSQLREEKMYTLAIPNTDFHNLSLLDVQAAV